MSNKISEVNLLDIGNAYIKNNKKSGYVYKFYRFGKPQTDRDYAFYGLCNPKLNTEDVIIIVYSVHTESGAPIDGPRLYILVNLLSGAIIGESFISL
jgi:hypothetical protein